jgi:hypothetical protein
MTTLLFCSWPLQAGVDKTAGTDGQDAGSRGMRRSRRATQEGGHAGCAAMVSELQGTCDMWHMLRQLA